MKLKRGRPKINQAEHTVPITVTLKPGYKKWLDAECRRRKMNRSQVLEALKK